MMVLGVVVALLMGIGVFFLTVAAIGFARLPDVFCRLHVTGVIDTMGGPLILLAAALYLGFSLEAGKLLLAIVFLYVTSPLVAHLLARAAVESGYRPTLEEVGDRRMARHYDKDSAGRDETRMESSVTGEPAGESGGKV